MKPALPIHQTPSNSPAADLPGPPWTDSPRREGARPAIPFSEEVPAKHLERLHRFFQPAAHEASVAMSRWTGGLIDLALNQVLEVPIEEVAEELDLGDEPLAMAVVSLSCDPGGDIILAWDEPHARALAGRLLGPLAATASPWGKLEVSALEETANILACAVFNALARLTGRELVPAPPAFFRDYGASVLGHAVVNQAGVADRVVLLRTGFRCQGERFPWQVLFLPSPALRDAMIGALGAPRGHGGEGFPEQHQAAEPGSRQP